MTLEIFYSYVFTVMTSLCFTPLLNWIGQSCEVVAKENNRTIHHGRIARIGGVAIFLSFMFGACIYIEADRQINAILMGGFIIFLTGLVDDMVDLKPKIKLLSQFIAAAIVIFYGDMVIHNLPVVPDSQWLSVIITFGWIIGVTNAINLIDGLDGLCAGVTSIVLVVIAFTAVTNQRLDIASISILLTGSICGFLCHNFHPATIFMGDCGALFIGYMISVISILGFGSESSVFFTLGAPIVMLAIPIMDTLIAILRRKLKHRRFDEADREHLHHTLMFKLDMGQTRSVIILYMTTILFALSSFIYIYHQRLGMTIFIALLLAFELFVEYTEIISVHYKPFLTILNVFIRSSKLPAFSKQKKRMELAQKVKEYDKFANTDVEFLLERERLKMKNKKQKNKIVGAFIFLGVIAIVIAGFFFFKSGTPDTPDTPPVVENELDYKESANSTDYMKSIYEQIETAVENEDVEALKGHVAAYFATDFFTWSNKDTREDVGGLAYVLPDARIDFAKYATNYYYVNFDEHKMTYGQSGLPEVSECVVNSIEKSDFVYAKTGNADSYDVDITLTYKENTGGMPTVDLMTNFTVTLLQEEGVFYVVGIDYQEVTSEE